MEIAIGERKKTVKDGLFLERATGIEPAYSAWEADILPMNYARKRLKRFDAVQILQKENIISRIS